MHFNGPSLPLLIVSLSLSILHLILFILAHLPSCHIIFFFFHGPTCSHSYSPHPPFFSVFVSFSLASLSIMSPPYAHARPRFISVSRLFFPAPSCGMKLCIIIDPSIRSTYIVLLSLAAGYYIFFTMTAIRFRSTCRASTCCGMTSTVVLVAVIEIRYGKHGK